MVTKSAVEVVEVVGEWTEELCVRHDCEHVILQEVMKTPVTIVHKRGTCLLEKRALWELSTSEVEHF